MKKTLAQSSKLIALAAALPFIYGCGGGAGVGSLVGFLFGGGLGAGEIALLSTGGAGSVIGTGGAGLAVLHNPEPASMLLVGSGLMAMGYFKSKSTHRKG